MSTHPDQSSSTNHHVTISTNTSIPFPPSGPSTPAPVSTASPTPQQGVTPKLEPSSPRPPQANGQHVPNPVSSAQPQSLPSRNTLSTYDRESASRKRKWSSLGFNETEQDSMERTTTAFHYALAQDQFSTLFPEAPTRFSSYEDVVQRLVPYHIWQTCDEELEGYEGADPKKKAAQQVKEEAHAAETLTRMTKINERFMRIRTSDAKKPSGTVDLIQLIKESTTALREELTSVQAQLKAATSNRHVIEWQERHRQQEQRRLEQERRDQEARRHAAVLAAQAQARAQAQAEAQAKAKAKAAASAAPAQATPTPTPIKKAAPAPAPAPATPSSSSVDTPSRPTPSPTNAEPASTSSRGRGRPKGGGGLRAQVLTQSVDAPSTPTASTSASTAQTGPSVAPSTSASTSPTATDSETVKPASIAPPATNPTEVSRKASVTPSDSNRAIPTSSTSPTPPPQNATPSGSARTTRASSGAGGANGVPGAGAMKGPVSITVPIASVPDLLRAEVLSRDPDGANRPPATIARKADDKKGVVLSIDLSKCNPKQLVALARVLKVDTAANGSGGTRDAVAKVADGNGST